MSRVAQLMRHSAWMEKGAAVAQLEGIAARVPCRSAVPARIGHHATPGPGVGGDATYLKVAGQWCYLAAVTDKHTRRIVGWSLGTRRDPALTREALAQSAWKRCVGPGVMFHSDQGIEFASFVFRKQLSALGMVQSMNRPGRMNGNAHIESFFHSMKREELYGQKFETDQQLRTTLSSYIRFYNGRRLHSSLRYLPPAVYERRMQGELGVS